MYHLTWPGTGVCRAEYRADKMGNLEPRVVLERRGTVEALEGVEKSVMIHDVGFGLFSYVNFSRITNSLLLSIPNMWTQHHWEPIQQWISTQLLTAYLDC